MSSQYTTEPPPTATVLIHTTAGPLTVSLFAQQTPLTCRNFLQHCLDGYYENNIFHRISAGFVIQTGDPTGTGEGGQNIYEDREFEKLDAEWAKMLRTDEGELVRFGDEIHSRLRFNRRGLIGMAKGTGDGRSYGSQFFITLGDCRPQLDGHCTMFGRVEGDGIYNIVKIAEGELLEGTERPMYPEKILRIEVIELPKQDAWQKMKKRDRTATRTDSTSQPVKKKVPKKKAGKALLSFGGDEGEDEAAPVKPKKAKINTSLFGDPPEFEKPSTTTNGAVSRSSTSERSIPATKPARSPPPPAAQKRKADPIPPSSSPQPKRHRPSFHDPMSQLPLRKPEIPSRSPTPPTPPTSRRRSSTSKQASAPDLQSQIAALKASMRRPDTSVTDGKPDKKLSAIESMIPATSIRGRRKQAPGDTNDKDAAASLSVLDAFRARLEKASTQSSLSSRTPTSKPAKPSNPTSRPDNHQPHLDRHHKDEDQDPTDEAPLCDLHFIANCASCFTLDAASPSHAHSNLNADADNNDAADRAALMTHSLTFEKDRLGKDFNWKKKNEAELLVIDPREREKGLGIGVGKGKRKEGGGGGGSGREWDRDRDRDRSGRGKRKDV